MLIIPHILTLPSNFRDHNFNQTNRAIDLSDGYPLNLRNDVKNVFANSDFLL